MADLFRVPVYFASDLERGGNISIILVGLIFGLGFVALSGRGASAAPWFIGLFAMGMAAATQQLPSAVGRLRNGLFGVMAAVGLIVYFIACAGCAFGLWGPAGGMESTYPYFWIMDCWIGGATACFLVYATGSIGRNWFVKLLSSKPLVRLGVMSYSLYLIHDPILALVRASLGCWGYQPLPMFSIMITGGLAVVLIATYCFHLCFERPFMAAPRVSDPNFQAANLPVTRTEVSLQPFA